MVKILIVDDHTLYRQGLRAQISAEMGMQVVGDASHAADGVQKAVELKPDIVLMDIDMPGASAFEATRRIHELLPQTRVIMLSGFHGERQIKDAIQAGAWGYALKTDGFEQVRAAIHSVHMGKAHYHPSIMERIENRNGVLTLKEAPRTLLDTLTHRERELFHLLAQGLGLKQAADVMKVQYKTADKHKVNLMRKLDVHDRTELVRIAYREGVFAPTPSTDDGKTQHQGATP